MKARVYFLFILVVVQCSALRSQSFLSLDQAITIGLHQNYQVIIDSNVVQAASINNSLGNAGFLPSLDLIGDISFSGQNIHQNFSNGTDITKDNVSNKSQTAGAYLTWTLFDGMNMFATAKLLRLQEAQVGSAAKDNMQNLVANIILTYYEAVQRKQLLRLSDSTLKYYDITLTTAKNLQLNGKGNRQQVLQAQIDLNAQKAQYYLQENLLEVAKSNLNNLLQRKSNVMFDVADSISLIPNFSVDTTEVFLRQHNPSLMIANRNVDVEYSILQQNRSLYYPQLDLNAGYGYNNSTSNASFFLKNQNQGWSAGLTLSWNIFNGFTTRNNVEISKINLSNAHLQYRQLLSETNTSLNTGWRNYKTAFQEMLLLRENLKLSYENLQLSTEMYKLFAITQVELLQSLKSFDDAGVAYTAAQYAVKKAEVNLLLLNGSLVQ